MAYQFCDGFDNYSTASQLYELVSGSPSFSSAYARFTPPAGLPGQGMKLPAGAYVRKNMQSNQPTFIIKIGYFQSATPSATTSIVEVYDGVGGFNQVSLCVTTAGGFQVNVGWQHGGPTGVASTGPGIITPGVYYGIEVQFIISSTVGVVNVWVNGIQVLAASSLNTQYTANAYGNAIQICDSLGNGTYVDDFRVWDATGSYQNAPIGTDSRLITKMPSAAGAYTNWTPNGASANWQCVDDNPPDGDTSYVSNSSATTNDAYSVPSAGFAAAPVMVVARGYMRKDDSATRTAAVGVVSSGSTALGPTITIGSTYQFIDGCISLDPHTSAAWTAISADAAQHLKQEVA